MNCSDSFCPDYLIAITLQVRRWLSFWLLQSQCLCYYFHPDNCAGADRALFLTGMVSWKLIKAKLKTSEKIIHLVDYCLTPGLQECRFG